MIFISTCNVLPAATFALALIDYREASLILLLVLSKTLRPFFAACLLSSDLDAIL
jgi:hypothetical protein